ncbi:hypothetical protein [Lacrimispora celerecrescens]|uniref:hypothetical protein n=1 Tax=Lacrimispora celerecrescens TaxID=29354 RepID=UPI0016492092|nr:hypothetical protein [Lacrimispora celerecrescens]
MAEFMPNVRLVVYKKIVDGDLRKFSATSNDQQTGGGARDLRFSPANEFMNVFEKMFPQYENGLLRGSFSWKDYPLTNVFIHPPTNSRPNEIRIATVHECFPTEVIPEEANDCILLLIQDVNGEIWPYFTSEYSLQHDNWHPYIKEEILKGMKARRSSKTTPMGYIDIDEGRSFTNGR